jgi:membrane protein
MNFGSIRMKLRRAWRFIAEDIWDVELTSMSAIRSFGVKVLRIINLVVKGFKEDECPLHASALTFNTLMAIVPILALSLALVRGLGDAETAKNKIRGAVQDWTQSFKTQNVMLQQVGAVGIGDSGDTGATDGIEVPEALPPSELADEINSLVDRAFEKVENISFKALGGFGLVLLLLMVITVLGKVEASFNKVWGVTTGRPLWRKFTDYLSVLVVLPVLVVAASSLPIADLAARVLRGPSAERLRLVLGSVMLKNLTVVVMTTLSFTFLIMFMPNTRVRILPGLAGGAVAALLFIGWLWLCAAAQVGVARSGKIYGSFAIVPILLAWVHVSWDIVLFGAEVAFAVQNCTTYRMEQGASRANVNARIALALSVLVEAGRAMSGERKSFEVSEYAARRRVPVRFLNDIVDELVHADYLAKLSDREGCFVMLKAVEAVGVKQVVDSIMSSGVKPAALGLESLDPGIRRTLERAGQGMDLSLGDITIRDLL